MFGPQGVSIGTRRNLGAITFYLILFLANYLQCVLGQQDWATTEGKLLIVKVGTFKSQTFTLNSLNLRIQKVLHLILPNLQVPSVEWGAGTWEWPC